MKSHFDSGKFKEVLPLILHQHYAARRCADPTRVYVARNDDYSVAACAVFAAPANRYFGRHAVELVRLVRMPYYTEPLSKLIAYSLKNLKREGRFYYCLAYADTDAEHHGGIYQACSFSYVGASKGHTMYRDAAGKVVSARSRDQSSKEVKAQLVAFKTGPKHLYIRGLTISTADAVARLGRVKLPYPKPALTSPPACPQCEADTRYNGASRTEVHWRCLNCWETFSQPIADGRHKPGLTSIK